VNVPAFTRARVQDVRHEANITVAR
jgi:hypothetical protein